MGYLREFIVHVFYFFFSCCVLHQAIFDHDITRCLWWYYCPQITGTTLECEIWWLQGNYSLCGGGGGASCRGVSSGLEAARWMLCWSYRSEVWQAFRQHFRGVSQISEWLKKSNPQSRLLEALRGPGMGRRSSAFSPGSDPTCCAEHNVVSTDR